MLERSTNIRRSSFIFICSFLLMMGSGSAVLAVGPSISSSPRYQEWRNEDFQRYRKQLGSPTRKYRVKAAGTIATEYRDFIEKGIIPLLKSKNGFERHSAVEILNLVALKQYVPDLLEVLRNEDQENTRLLALRALDACGDKDIYPSIMEHYKKAALAEKAVIIEILGRNKFEKAIPLFKKALEHEDDVLRTKAVTALANFKRLEFLDIFFRMYEDPAANVRYQVIKAFHPFNVKNSPRIIALLERAKKTDTNHRVKRVAKKMLRFDRMH